jgi:putative phosphoesterase
MTRGAAGAVAVLADIHGVLPALDAVLAEPRVRAAERVVLLGDVAAGPQPVEVLDRLAGLGERAVWVRGNADRELVALASGADLDAPDPISAWAATQLSPGHLDALSRLRHPVTLAVDGFGDVLFCHGSPRDDEEVVLVDTRLTRWADVLADLPETVSTVVCGHTHMPFVRLAHRRTVVNPGSVGMPYGVAGAHWALLHDGAVTLRRTRYDVPAAIERITGSCGYPDVAEWVEYFLNARAGDDEALAAFAPRDGR